jgi:hypothetical protein
VGMFPYKEISKTCLSNIFWTGFQESKRSRAWV